MKGMDTSPLPEKSSSTLLSLPRMAIRLGVACSWLKAEALAGRVPCLRAGRSFLFNPKATEKRLLERASRESLSIQGVANG